MKKTFRCVGGFLVWAAAALAAETQISAKSEVRELKITVLSTMLADGQELGEWGFAALVEADGHRILFDTGAHTDIVLKNAASLHIDLGTVPEVILSHSHSDHVGGFLTLRQSVLKHPHRSCADSRGRRNFYPRISLSPGIDDNPLHLIKDEYEKNGGVFVSHDHPVQLYPGVWLTGPVPRKYPERNWSGSGKWNGQAGIVEDNLPEDMALVCDTAQGLVVLTGCAHAGVVNILDYARTIIRPARIHALIGGVHLFAATDETLSWTAQKLQDFGVDNLLGAHCTGIEKTVYRFRSALGLDRNHAVVAAVGAKFELGKGIDPRNIAK